MSSKGNKPLDWKCHFDLSGNVLSYELLLSMCAQISKRAIDPMKHEAVVPRVVRPASALRNNVLNMPLGMQLSVLEQLDAVLYAPILHIKSN